RLSYRRHGGALDLRAVPRSWVPARGISLRRRLRAGGDRHHGIRHVGPTHGMSGVRAVAAWKNAQDVLDVLAPGRRSSPASTGTRKRAEWAGPRLHSRIAFPIGG